MLVDSSDVCYRDIPPDIKGTCIFGVEEGCHEKLLSCSLKNSENPRSVPISDVPTARREKASTISDTPLHFTLTRGNNYALGLEITFGVKLN